ncbi:MAG: hypothetical protein ACE5IB_05890 [Candidatus Geothermarchaeales archaeon]
MPVRYLTRALALFAPALLLVAVMLVPQPAQGGTFAVFKENFEGDWPDPWLIGDDNLDAGADYWGVSGFRETQGKKSAWAAQEGKNSLSGLPNEVIRKQDDSMDAYMRVDLGELVGLDSLTLTFKYWIEAGSGDNFSVRVSNGTAWTTVWSLSGPVAQGWTTGEAFLPLSTRLLEFRYVTADSHEDDYEGVYVDEVEVLGEDSTPPSLTVLEPADGVWFASKHVLLGWTASDAASGLAFVEVQLDEGAWINAGQANSFLFQNLSEGSHSVAVRAVDTAGNVRVQTLAFGVDVTPPDVILLGPQEGSTVTSSTVEVSWTGGDSVSGIAYYEVRVDGGPWVQVGSVDSHELTGLADGAHQVRVRAVDLALNSQEVELTFTVNTNPLHPEGPAKGALLYGLIAAGVVGSLFMLHKKEKVDFRAHWRRFKELLRRFGGRNREV